MNSRIIAVAAAVIMALAGVVCITSDADAAEPIEKGTVLVPVDGGTGSAVATISFTEQELIAYDYTLTVKAASGSSAETTFDTTLGTINNDADASRTFTDRTTLSGGFTVDLKDPTDVSDTKPVGVFEIEITATAAATGSFIVECQATVGGTALTPLYYTFNVIAYDAGSGSAGPAIALEAMEDLVVGKNHKEQVTVSGSTISVGDFFWSATGLPAGLSMSADGYITGTPIEAATTSVNVIMTDRYSNTQIATTLSIKVAAQSASEGTLGENDFSYAVTVGDGSEVSNPASVNAESGQSVVVEITDGGSPVQNVSVTVVSSTGAIDDAVKTNENGQVTISAAGTGSYKVIMTDSTDGHPAVTKVFTLNVLPQLEDVDADITIVSQ